MWEKICKNRLKFSPCVLLAIWFAAPPTIGGICFPQSWVWPHLMSCCSKSDTVPILRQPQKARHIFALPFENLPSHHIKNSGLVCWMMKDLWPNCSRFSSWQPASPRTELRSWPAAEWLNEWNPVRLREGPSWPLPKLLTQYHEPNKWWLFQDIQLNPWP